MREFSNDEVLKLSRLMAEAFRTTPNSVHHLGIAGLPGAIYTKIRTRVSTGGELGRIFCGTFANLNCRMGSDQQRIYQQLYAQHSNAWLNDGGEVNASMFDADDPEFDLDQLKYSVSDAKKSVLSATTVAIRAENITTQLEKIEQELKGDE